jgi:hypothetical protein
MKYADLLSVLENHPGQELVFEFEHGQIRRDYHITEVINTSTKSIDCGGALESRSETVLQLLEPRFEDGELFMQAKTALGIFRKSAQLIDLPSDGTLILEYRPQDSSAAQRYNVQIVESNSGKILVKTVGTTTQCRAILRVAPGTDTSCCGAQQKAAKTKSNSACYG